MLKNEKVTDTLIKTSLADKAITAIRDTLMPLLKVKFFKSRLKASWCLLHKNGWHKVGEWPEVKASVIRAKLPELLTDLRQYHKATVASESFITIGDLLNWYGDRVDDDVNLSPQRKSDINSAINCHLMPKLANVLISELDRYLLDKQFIRPLQKSLATASIKKAFTTLRTAFITASKLRLLPEHAILSIRTSDFGLPANKPKEGAIKPVMVGDLLIDFHAMSYKLKVLCLLMLSLGTRIGETRKARWEHFHLLNNSGVWHIPAKTTKTKAAHAVELPMPVVALLKQWRIEQRKNHYSGAFVFPSNNDKNHLGHDEASKLLRDFTSKAWHYHDLRKCARQAWISQGVDFLVAERMLNHKLNKQVEAYVDKADGPRFNALVDHCNWLISQNPVCFVLNPNSAANDNNLNDDFSGDVA